ncbi:transcriptional regulator [Alicyclobacillus fastidiosus]|nr:transcriptional regulator [Alicyclobacillus fastidiosus]
MCPKFEAAFELLGKRWTGLIIRVMLQGRRRFSDISGMIPHLSDRMLVERLKELEAAEIVTRHVYPDMPIRVEYELTMKGQELAPVLDQVQEWANKWYQTLHH